MDYQDSIEIVTKILRERLNIDEEKITSSHYDDSLIHGPIKLSSIDLAYLFLEVEQAIGCQIPATLLSNREFNSINKIASIIMKCSQ